MRSTTTRTLTVAAVAALVLGGVTSSAWGGDTGSSKAKPVAKVTWCKQASGVMRQVGATATCRLGETKYVLSAGQGPAGPRGATGATGARGATGATGAPGADGTDGTDGLDGTDGTDGIDGTNGTDGIDGTNGADGAPGPSDVYISAHDAGFDVAAGGYVTVVTLDVPAGSYQLSLTAYGTGADADAILTCRVTASGATTAWVQPRQVVGIVSGPVGASTNPGIATNGAISSAGAQTLTAECGVTAGTTSIVATRLTAIKTGSLHVTP